MYICLHVCLYDFLLHVFIIVITGGHISNTRLNVNEIFVLQQAGAVVNPTLLHFLPFLLCFVYLLFIVFIIIICCCTARGEGQVSRVCTCNVVIMRLKLLYVCCKRSYMCSNWIYVQLYEMFCNTIKMANKNAICNIWILKPANAWNC